MATCIISDARGHRKFWSDTAYTQADRIHFSRTFQQFHQISTFICQFPQTRQHKCCSSWKFFWSAWRTSKMELRIERWTSISVKSHSHFPDRPSAVEHRLKFGKSGDSQLIFCPIWVNFIVSWSSLFFFCLVGRHFGGFGDQCRMQTVDHLPVKTIEPLSPDRCQTIKDSLLLDWCSGDSRPYFFVLMSPQAACDFFFKSSRPSMPQLLCLLLDRPGA